MEEPPLGLGAYEPERPAIREARVARALQPAQQIGAGGVQVVVVVELDPVYRPQPRLGSLRLG